MRRKGAREKSLVLLSTLTGAAVTVALLTTDLAAYSAHAQSLTNVFGSAKGKSMHPDFKQIADIREDDDISSLDFSPDGTILAAGTFRTLHINLWDWGKGRIAKTFQKPPVNFDFTSGDGIRYSPDGQLLAVAHGLSPKDKGSSVVSVFNVSTGATVHEIEEPLGGGVSSKIAFSPDGKILYRTYDSRKSAYQFTAYSTASWELLQGLSVLPLNVDALSVSPDGKFAALGGYVYGPKSRQAQIMIVELGKGKILKTIDDPFPATNHVQQVAWHPDGTHVAAGAIVGGTYAGPDAIRVFEIPSGAIVAREGANSAKVLSLKYTSNGKYLIESGIDGSVNIWDGLHSTLLKRIENKKANALAVSTDSRFLAISDGKSAAVYVLP
jgi:WD40 repeat protein